VWFALEFDAVARAARSVVVDPPVDRHSIPLLTLDDVAARLAVSYWSARNFVLTGKLPAIRLPHEQRRRTRTFREGRHAGATQTYEYRGGWRVTEADLQKFIDGLPKAEVLSK
jgi:hypothetical protein